MSHEEPDATVLHEVALANVPIAIGDERVIFHGVNKSGSGALEKVLWAGFMAAGRSNRVFSRYHACAPSTEFLADMIRQSEGGQKLCYVDHNIYRAEALADTAVTYLTVLRHPLPRIVSIHSWLNRDKEDAPGIASLERFVAKSRGVGHSQMLQFALGADATRAAKRLPAAEVHEKAVANVAEDVRLIGIAEMFEETIFLFAHLLGLPAVPAWIQDRRNPRRPLAETLPPPTVKLIEDVFAHEFDFYERALKRFRSIVDQVDFGASFARYRAACAGEYKDRILLAPAS